MNDSVSQVEYNYSAYVDRHQAEAERQHTGEVALMADGEIVGYYPDGGCAYLAGVEKYGIGHFSIQMIGFPPAQLGALTPPA